MLVSTEILLEYREVIERQRRFVTWARFAAILDKLDELGYLIEVSPHFRFSVVRDDPDDNKFADCAITGHALAIVTYDPHFRSVAQSGYEPIAMTPQELAARFPV